MTARRSSSSVRRPISAKRAAPMIGTRAMPRMWHCIVTAVPAPARSHQRGCCAVRARHAPARAIELERAMRFGFQRNVDSSMAAIETAMTRPAISPAIDPAMDRASHQVTPTAAMPTRAISATTASGESPPVNAAAGARR